MPEHFPTAPQAPRWVRLTAFVIALLALALATSTTIDSLALVGRVFPGFLIFESRTFVDGSPGRYVVIAPFKLSHWSSATVPGLSNAWLVSVNDERVSSVTQVYAALTASPPGTPIRYRLQDNREVTIPTQRFTARDWFLVPGLLLLNGAVFLLAGLAGWMLRPTDPLTWAFLAVGATVALILLPGPAIYTAPFCHLHTQLATVGFSLVPAAVLQLALLFPVSHRYARWRLAGYAISFAFFVPHDIFFYLPPAYWRPWYVGWWAWLVFGNNLYLALGVIFGFAHAASAYWSAESLVARQRVRVVTLGALFCGGLFLLNAVRGDFAANIGILLWLPLFPASVAYAVLKHDLFEIEAMVKHGTYYLLLTGAVAGAYVGTVVIFNVVMQQRALANSLAFPVFFTLAVLFLFDPLRRRLRGLVDRVFFGAHYDGAQMLASLGTDLASALTRDSIVGIVRRCIDHTIPNACTRLFANNAAPGGWCEVGGTGGVPAPLVERLAQGHVVTAFDSVETYSDIGNHREVQVALGRLGAEIAVPMHLQGELVGVLTAGKKRSGLYYTASDAEFLRALAHGAAIALQNAASYETVVALNATLEERVRARTAQLVQSEKLAALGRLVAGVAHEINNPVSFIVGNLEPLQENLAELRCAAAAQDSAPLVELVDRIRRMIDTIGRGAERTAGIVQDLRTFSRVGDAARRPVDVNESLEVNLRLLKPKWHQRITIERHYGTLPAIRAVPGQINQVFMNLLANACDAIPERGTIRVTTAIDGDRVRVTISDDGVGIPEDALDRIFDPFFTTKPLGQGTGLGLSISHGIAEDHGGRLMVQSRVGKGTTFTVELPVHSAD